MNLRSAASAVPVSVTGICSKLSRVYCTIKGKLNASTTRDIGSRLAWFVKGSPMFIANFCYRIWPSHLERWLTHIFHHFSLHFEWAFLRDFTVIVADR